MSSISEHLFLSDPGELDKPPIDVDPNAIRHMAMGTIGVLDADGKAVGPWIPNVSQTELLDIYEAMVTTRAFDARMLISQRQGKTSFAIESTGEEAIGAAIAKVMGQNDMAFPTYRQASYLISRGYPVLQMMNQIYGNENDPFFGTRLPGLYSSREHGFFTISGGLGTQVPQAVGWAMATAFKSTQPKKEESVALAFVGDGSTATSDLHTAMTFASSFKPPVIIAIVNNQYAISTHETTARGMASTFAQRGIGYGLPSLRVDGNDVLAVLSTTKWARDRALSGHGPTVIEYLTYRAGAHSTSDDPTRYRPKDEYTTFALGDPVNRLTQHLEGQGHTADGLDKISERARLAVEALNVEAEAAGTITTHAPPSIAKAFEVVYEKMPQHLAAQRSEAGF